MINGLIHRYQIFLLMSVPRPENPVDQLALIRHEKQPF